MSHSDGDKKTILVMGNAFGSQAFVQAAKRMGLNTVSVDGAPYEKCRAKQLADEYWDVECSDIDELERLCRESNIAGVVSGASNFCIEREADLCERLGINACFTGPGRIYETDKSSFKDLCVRTGVPICKDYSVADESIKSGKPLDIDYPVVTKPTDRAGNAGVSYCYDDDDLRAGYKLAVEESISGNVVIEKMMTGDEWFSYYAVGGGEAKFIALCAMLSQPGYPKNVYSITTTSTSMADRYIAEMDEPVREMLSQAGCTDGVAWVQVMTDDKGKFHAIEMGYRIDGEMMGEVIRRISNYDTLEWMIQYAIGDTHSAEDLDELFQIHGIGIATSYMLWVDKACTLAEVRGLDELESDDFFYIDCVKSPGDELKQYSAIAIIDFATEDVEQTIDAIKRINETVSVVDTEGNDVLIRFTDFDQLSK